MDLTIYFIGLPIVFILCVITTVLSIKAEFPTQRQDFVPFYLLLTVVITAAWPIALAWIGLVIAGGLIGIPAVWLWNKSILWIIAKLEAKP